MINLVATLIISLISLMIPKSSFAADLGSPKFRGVESCPIQAGVPKIETACKDEVSSEEKNDVLLALSKQPFIAQFRKNSLIVAVKLSDDQKSDNGPPFLCCELKVQLDQISKNIYLAKISWDKMDQALLDIELTNIKGDLNTKVRSAGSKEFIRPDRSIDNRVIQKAGFSQSEYLISLSPESEARKLVTYRGKDCIATIKKCTVIYLADGESTFFFLKHSIVHNINLNRFIFVGIFNDPTNSVEKRIDEMLFGYDDFSYKEFMRLATSLAIEKVERTETPLRRYVAGFSNGGAWALDALYDHAEKFDGAIVMSPGEWEFRKNSSLPSKSIFIGAGLLETGVRRSSGMIAKGFQSREATVVELYPPSGHSMNSWISIWMMAIKKLSDDI